MNVSFWVLIKSESNSYFENSAPLTCIVLFLNSEYPNASQNMHTILKPNLTLNRNMDKTGKDRSIIDLRYLN